MVNIATDCSLLKYFKTMPVMLELEIDYHIICQSRGITEHEVGNDI